MMIDFEDRAPSSPPTLASRVVLILIALGIAGGLVTTAQSLWTWSATLITHLG